MRKRSGRCSESGRHRSRRRRRCWRERWRRRLRTWRTFSVGGTQADAAAEEEELKQAQPRAHSPQGVSIHRSSIYPLR